MGCWLPSSRANEPGEQARTSEPMPGVIASAQWPLRAAFSQKLHLQLLGGLYGHGAGPEMQPRAPSARPKKTAQAPLPTHDVEVVCPSGCGQQAASSVGLCQKARQMACQ